MTPEITDPQFQAIAKAIAADPANADYTKRGVEPLLGWHDYGLGMWTD